jgi:hypothetical protein
VFAAAEQIITLLPWGDASSSVPSTVKCSSAPVPSHHPRQELLGHLLLQQSRASQERPITMSICDSCLASFANASLCHI